MLTVLNKGTFVWNKNKYLDLRRFSENPNKKG